MRPLVFLSLLAAACGPGGTAVPFVASEHRADVYLRAAADRGNAGILAATLEGYVFHDTDPDAPALSKTVTDTSGRADDFAVGAFDHDFLVCTELQRKTRCGAPGVAPTFETAGRHPSLAHGPKGWVVAYASEAGTVLQPLAPSGAAAVKADSAANVRPVLTATPTGFVLLGGDPLAVMRFDADLKPVGDDVLLQPEPERAGSERSELLWYDGHVAVHGQTTAVSIQVPFGAYVFLIEGGQVRKRYALHGGAHAGVEIAFATGYGDQLNAGWRDGDTFRMVLNVTKNDNGRFLPRDINEQTTGGSVGFVFAHGPHGTAVAPSLNAAGEVELLSKLFYASP